MTSSTLGGGRLESDLSEAMDGGVREKVTCFILFRVEEDYTREILKVQVTSYFSCSRDASNLAPREEIMSLVCFLDRIYGG